MNEIAPPGRGDVTVTEPTRGQSQLARRVAESRATIPAFVVRGTVDMRACAELLAALDASAGEPAPTHGDLVVKATALALREHPKANGAYRDGHFERYSRVNVGVTVATDSSVLVPTIFDADRKSLSEIAAATRALTARAQAGEITQPELSGATFTISDLGSFGVRSFEAVITPTQAAVLAVGAVQERVVARGGEIVIREQLDVELACDQRILYGPDAAQLLARIAALLEAPAGMLEPRSA